MRHIRAERLDRLKTKGRCDADIWLMFLNAYNTFINHAPKSFCPFIEKNMKLKKTEVGGIYFMDFLALAKKFIAEGDEERARSIIMKGRFIATIANMKV